MSMMSTGMTAEERGHGTSSPLLTIAEAVNYLRLGQSTIYERMDEFEVVRLGRRVFLTKASLDAFIKANTQKPLLGHRGRGRPRKHPRAAERRAAP